MKNMYEIRGETTAIFFNTKYHGMLEILIETNDLDKVLRIPGRLYGSYDSTIDGYYISFSIQVNGKKRGVRLHRYLMDCPDGKQVDHINRKTLDNRGSNLRIVTSGENVQNKSVNVISKSGHKNVTYVKKLNKWQVRVTLNGVRHSLGFFIELDDAIKKAKESRSYFHQCSEDRKKTVISNDFNPFKHREAARPGSRSGVKGICWSKSKERWIIHLNINGKSRTVGQSRDLEEAKQILKRKKEKYTSEVAS